MKKNIIRIVLGLMPSLVFLAHSARVYPTPLLQALDASVDDARLRLTVVGDAWDGVTTFGSTYWSA